MNKLLSAFGDFFEGILLGITIATGIATIILACLFFMFINFKLFSLTLFWGLMSLMFGMLYYGYQNWRRDK